LFLAYRCGCCHLYQPLLFPLCLAPTSTALRDIPPTRVPSLCIATIRSLSIPILDPVRSASFCFFLVPSYINSVSFLFLSSLSVRKILALLNYFVLDSNGNPSFNGYESSSASCYEHGAREAKCSKTRLMLHRNRKIVPPLSLCWLMLAPFSTFLKNFSLFTSSRSRSWPFSRMTSPHVSYDGEVFQRAVAAELPKGNS